VRTRPAPALHEDETEAGYCEAETEAENFGLEATEHRWYSSLLTDMLAVRYTLVTAIAPTLVLYDVTRALLPKTPDKKQPTPSNVISSVTTPLLNNYSG